MEIYTKTSYKISELLTKQYSTSFSSSAKLFPRNLRRHIYAIYGLVRIADEIVDTDIGPSPDIELQEFKQETYRAIKQGYSTNPIIHAFAITAARYDIDSTLIEPFFQSMAIDLNPQTFSTKLYRQYIHGSAEVIGLMCLKVFCENDNLLYKKLVKGAAALGSAYQKVNFLRDIASDHSELGRIYFPGYTYESFDDAAKKAIIEDIDTDLKEARLAIDELPRSSMLAVKLSYAYYKALLGRLERASINDIKSRRIRIPAIVKFALISKMVLTGYIK